MDVDRRRAGVRVSIHAFRGEGDLIYRYRNHTRGVSIHAFRGEGDLLQDGSANTDEIVSIHAFRGEGDITPNNVL